MTVSLHHAPVPAIDPVLLYRMLQLRVEVFVVEQDAAYADLDGRDVEPGAELVWAQRGDDVVATLRVLREPGAMRIGRVVAHPSVRGTDAAARMMAYGVALCERFAPRLPIEIDAQSALAGWYRRFGFEVSGEQFEEDGIPHLPMTRPAAG